MGYQNEQRDINVRTGNYFEKFKNYFGKIRNYFSFKANNVNIVINDGNLENFSEPIGLPHNIPQSSTDKFVGREQKLEQLHQQLQNKESVTIAHVEGMGGIGKTELAIQYARKHLKLNNYPGGICWLGARDQDIGSQIVNFASIYLDLEPPEKLELKDQVAWCWTHWREGNTLIVLDDVTNYNEIKPYLPPDASQFRVLITTRLKLDLANPLFLEVLTESEALELLKQLVGAAKVNEELATAQELCQRLGYLPLALQLVSRYIKKRGISLAEELGRLDEEALNHGSLNVPQHDATWTSNITLGVVAAFELSWEELSNSAQELACLLSLFALAPIPWSLVEATAEQAKEDLEDSRLELENSHLLQGQDTYRLHQLVQEFLREKQNKLAIADEQKRNFCQAMVEIAKEIPQAITLTLAEINNLTPKIPHMAETATIYQNWLSDEDLIWPFIGLGRFYGGQGAYEQAFPWRQKSLSVAKDRFGEEHSDVAASLNNLAALYREQGRYTEAEPLFLQALELGKQLLGEQHPDVAQGLNNLALLYDNQGRYAEAEPLFLQALELRKQLLGEQHLDVALSLNNLAGLYYYQGRYSEAEPLFSQALELRKQLLGEQHPDVALSFYWLAFFYKSQGRYAEAEPLYQKALAIYEQILGKDHPDTINCQNNYEIFKQAKNE
ncbi:MAG: tetratricopeptide repeat protein [Cyanobacteria bacterium P01_F01_bin.143]